MPAPPHRTSWIVGGCLWLGLLGCNASSPDSSGETATQEQAPAPVALTIDGQPEISVATLRRQLGANSRAQFTKAGGLVIEAHLMDSGVTDLAPLSGLPLKFLDLTNLPISDLTPLAGMPLVELYLEGTQVRDSSPLAGMPLRILRLEHTPVDDISPLRGMKLFQLSLFNTEVSDLTPLVGMPLNTLWLTGTPVADLSTVDGLSLESLDIEQTAISDLTPLAGKTSLKRLNIANTAVTDVTPLQRLPLERLIFTPENITTGLEILQAMPTLQQLGPQFEQVAPAAQFWAQQAAQQSPPPPTTPSPASPN